MTDTHREAIEAAARAMAVMQCCGPEGCYCTDPTAPDEWDENDCEAADDIKAALAAIRAFLARVAQDELSKGVAAAGYAARQDDLNPTYHELGCFFRAMVAQMRIPRR